MEFGVGAVEELRGEASLFGGGFPEAVRAEVADEEGGRSACGVFLEPGEAPYADVAGQDFKAPAAVVFEKLLDAFFYAGLVHWVFPLTGGV